jgi:hypothetical protein
MIIVVFIVLVEEKTKNLGSFAAFEIDQLEDGKVR